MWKKIAIAGGIAAAVVGSGTAALAVAGDSGSATPAPSSGATSSAAPAHPGKGNGKGHGGHGLRARAGKFQHGEWVTKGTSGDETHDAIHGTVSLVSASSISVKAEDGFSLTFGVNADTKVVLRESGKGSAKKATIAGVKSGDHVYVTGLKSGSTLGAKHVVDTGTK